MRYMYKLIFLFVMEDRDLLLRKSGEQNFDSDVELGRKRYTLGYSTQRHRNVITSIKGDEHNNFFEEVKVVFKSLYKGESRLALPALGSYLFSDESTPMIDNSTIPNSDFLKTLFHLCTFKKKDGPRQRVHWKTLRETELGSVYESLLELRPDIDLDNGSFTLISEAGNDRKSSGSYYTPSELVDHLVTTTIDPLLKEAKKIAHKSSDNPEERQTIAIESILKLTVCDPACGSGHFLVAALERIAMELARIETGEHHPGLTFIRKWKRLASSRCIYGVDLNPLAVELCKVAIWMDTYDGTNPLSFLDGHIRHGNSLLGQRFENMGLIPDDAIPKAWIEQRKLHRKFNRDQIKMATKDAELKLKKIQKEYGKRKQRSKQGLDSDVELPSEKFSVDELKEKMQQLKKIQKVYGGRKRRSIQQGLSKFVELPQDVVSDEELIEKMKQLKEILTQSDKLRSISGEMGLEPFDFEIPEDWKSDEELKEEMQQLKKSIEDKDTKKLLPPEIIWSTVDLPSVIEDIATQQAELTLMSESTLEEVQEKSNKLQGLVNDGRSGWAKEVLDASMAMWWWPDPDVDEFSQMMADPPIPLASMELNRYATWLAYEYGIEDDVLANPTNTNHNFAGEDVRFRLIRAHTERIAGEQSFFHWELEFAEVFFNEE
jgi:type I restriction-modification system DNA methylase subunit